MSITTTTAAALPIWSWRELLTNAPLMGIPHFQRGFVWDATNRVALLESLLDGSPCGMFVVWRPRPGSAIQNLGISLLTGEPVASSETIWLVDGQQRSRTLVSIFRECVAAELGPDANGARPPLVPEPVRRELSRLLAEPIAESGTDDVEDDVATSEDGGATDAQTDTLASKGAPAWYVSLPRLLGAEGAPGSPTEQQGHHQRSLRYATFRVFRDGALTQARSTAPAGLVPLALFLGEDDPFASSPVREALQALRAGDLAAMQALVPWGPLWLKGRAMRWDASIDRTPLVNWLERLLSDRETADRPLTTRLQQLHGLFRAPRFVVGSLPATDLAGAIGAYVRINRAGVHVRDEERAMAVLMRFHPGLLRDLESFLERRGPKLPERKDVRAALTHASDKTLGFGLWMQVVARYVVLTEFALLPKLAKSSHRWLGADLLEKWTVRQQLNTLMETSEGLQALTQRTQEATARASAALLLLDGLLSQELFFDHRMARPDVQQGWPLLEIFSRLSLSELTSLDVRGSAEVRGKVPAREALSYALHLSMLGQPLARDKQQALCDTIHGVTLEPDSSLEQKLARLLRAFLAKLAEIRRTSHAMSQGSSLDELRRLAIQRFEKLVDESRSLQAPAVGWLYALERRGAAKDFHWATQHEAWLQSNAWDDAGKEDFLWRGCQPGTRAAEAVPLAAIMYDELGATPEKQHIVPFSDARKILREQTGTRASSSLGNDVGNLTWISSEQNHLDRGFSDNWMVLSADQDLGNLRAHGFVDDAAAAPSARVLFEKMGETIAQEPFGNEYKAREDFEAFCAYRRNWMKRVMADWIQQGVASPAARRLLDDDETA